MSNIQEIKEIKETTAMIAKRLQETGKEPISQINRVIRCLGIEQARAFLEEALHIEEQGGLMLPDGSRRRTLGGVFFHLVRQRAAKKDRRWIFFVPRPKGEGETPSESSSVPIEQLLAKFNQWERGIAMSVKITVIGRPGKVQNIRNQFIAFTLESKKDKVPNLPKSMPPVKSNTTYLVMVANKQWNKVKDSITNDREDRIIVEGYCSLDKEAPGAIAIRATMVTTVNTQKARREVQKAPTGATTKTLS